VTVRRTAAAVIVAVAAGAAGAAAVATSVVPAPWADDGPARRWSTPCPRTPTDHATTPDLSATGAVGVHRRPAAGAAGTEPAESRLHVGVTHTQFSAETGGALGRRRARCLLAARPMVQNQHLMGWGAGNPEPAPGQYDWGSLDARVDLIRRTDGTPVLTLCCAPDWMKGGRAGTPD
jgi:hypothetical protein